MRVRVMPVLVACRGCEQERAAWQAARELDRRGLVEAVQPGSSDARVRSRYPVYVIEGCGEACGKQWLAARGVQPVASFALDPAADLQAQIDEIAGALAR